MSGRAPVLSSFGEIPNVRPRVPWMIRKRMIQLRVGSRRSGPVVRPKSMRAYRPWRGFLQGERGHIFANLRFHEEKSSLSNEIMTAMRQKRSEFLFVYGSLMSNARGRLGMAERRALRWHARRIGLATRPGKLHDLGGYPGLVISRRGPPAGHVRGVHDGVVYGEVWRIIDGRRVWPLLDAYEGLDRVPPHYARALARVRLVSGRCLTVWVYLALDHVSALPRAPRGRWRG